jgi:hypothetical protein
MLRGSVQCARALERLIKATGNDARAHAFNKTTKKYYTLYYERKMANVARETKLPLLPTMPIPVEVIQSSEVSSVNRSSSGLAVGSSPCSVPIATLSIRDLRLRGSSFIRSHASKHGLPNASRKLMKEVIELLKTHYAVVHQQVMLDDDFGDPTTAALPPQQGGGKMSRKKPPKQASVPVTMLPQQPPRSHVALVPLQVQMTSDQALFTQVASIVDRMPIDRQLNGHVQLTQVSQAPVVIQQTQAVSQPQQFHHQATQIQIQDTFSLQEADNQRACNGNANAAGIMSPCSSRVLAR